MQEVLRSEKKFLLDRAEYMRKSHELAQLLHMDSHGGADGYLVRSLYFDTEYDSDFFDKEYGIEVRKKLRLRIYDPESESAVLEMKQKQGTQQRKRSLRLHREEAKRLVACDYSPLKKYDEAFARECYCLMNSRCYRPRAIVQYQRKAFLVQENSIRITFDHQIKATESNFDLFSPCLALNPVFPESQVVLEVKYNGFLLTYIKQMLADVEKSELSVSKYCLARQNSYYANL